MNNFRSGAPKLSQEKVSERMDTQQAGWMNYNNLSRPHPQIVVSVGNSPQATLIQVR